VQLVQQPRGQQLADHGDRAAHADGARTGFVLQRGDELDEVALQLFRVPPAELEVLVRHDDLADVAEHLGEVSVLLAGRFPVGPGPGEAVVGLATEQHGVGGTEGGVHGGTHLVVVVREVPLVGRLDDAVQRDEKAGDDLLHDASPTWSLTFRRPLGRRNPDQLIGGIRVGYRQSLIRAAFPRGGVLPSIAIAASLPGPGARVAVGSSALPGPCPNLSLRLRGQTPATIVGRTQAARQP
jgi:hypothetical protein